MAQKYGVQNMQARLRLHIGNTVNIFSRYHQTHAMLGELGRHNLYVHYFCKSVTFWLSIVQDNTPRLRNSLYRMLKCLDDVDRHTWASEIKQLLCVYGFRHVWLNQGVGDNSLFIETYKQRLMDTSSQDWHSDVLNSRKLELYSTYKSQLSSKCILLLICITNIILHTVASDV